MRLYRLVVLCFSLCLMLSPSVFAADAQLMLQQMASSFRQLNYDAVVVFERDGRMQTARVIHIVRNGKEVERVQYLDGNELEVIRGEHPIDCIHPGGYLLDGVGASKLIGVVGEVADNALEQQYRLQLVAGGRVAGRSATVLNIQPLDQYRYGYDLYLDDDSKLLLKSVVRDKRGKVLESFQFVQLKLGAAVDSAAVESQTNNVIEESFHAMPIHVDNTLPRAWTLAWLPTGFIMSSGGQRKMPHTSVMVQSSHYTDGLSAFSVFIEPSAEKVEVYQMTTGSTLAYTAPYRMGEQWLSVTVVGEIPLETAVKLVSNIRMSKAS